MKEFIRKHNISQTNNGKPCYLSIAKFQQGQEKENIPEIFFDEDNLFIWAYNPQGWNSSSEATDFVIQSLLTRLPITRKVPENRPQQAPIRLTRNTERTTQQTVQRQRENSWETKTKVIQEQGFQSAIPKRKKHRPRPDTTLSMQKQGEQTIEREPANKEVMDYLKKQFCE